MAYLAPSVVFPSFIEPSPQTLEDVFERFIGEPATHETFVALNASINALCQARGEVGSFSLSYNSPSDLKIVLDESMRVAQDRICRNKIIWPIADPAEKIKKMMKQNLLIKVVPRGNIVGQKICDPAEQKAQNTLRDMLTERDWRRYVTNGFIMVKGRSDFWYQIFANSHQRSIRVYHNGTKVHNICIHTDSTCPPTDHVIVMKTLIEMDETSLWLGGNVSNYFRTEKEKYPFTGDLKPNLSEKFNQLKKSWHNG